MFIEQLEKRSLWSTSICFLVLIVFGIFSLDDVAANAETNPIQFGQVNLPIASNSDLPGDVLFTLNGMELAQYNWLEAEGPIVVWVSSTISVDPSVTRELKEAIASRQDEAELVELYRKLYGKKFVSLRFFDATNKKENLVAMYSGSQYVKITNAVVRNGIIYWGTMKGGVKAGDKYSSVLYSYNIKTKKIGSVFSFSGGKFPSYIIDFSTGDGRFFALTLMTLGPQSEPKVSYILFDKKTNRRLTLPISSDIEPSATFFPITKPYIFAGRNTLIYPYRKNGELTLAARNLSSGKVRVYPASTLAEANIPASLTQLNSAGPKHIMLVAKSGEDDNFSSDLKLHRLNLQTGVLTKEVLSLQASVQFGQLGYYPDFNSSYGSTLLLADQAGNHFVTTGETDVACLTNIQTIPSGLEAFRYLTNSHIFVRENFSDSKPEMRLLYMPWQCVESLKELPKTPNKE